MNIDYPRRQVFREIKRAVLTGKDFSVALGTGWRSRILKRHVGQFLREEAGECAPQIGGGFFLLAGLNPSFVAGYFYAKAAGYKAHFSEDRSTVLFSSRFGQPST